MRLPEVLARRCSQRLISTMTRRNTGRNDHECSDCAIPDFQNQQLVAATSDEVADFVDFLAAGQAKQAALNRLLTIAPALEAAGAKPMSMDEINVEVRAARAERRARLRLPPAPAPSKRQQAKGADAAHCH